MLVIGLTGMPGSGKTLVAEELGRRGFANLSMSSFVAGTSDQWNTGEATRRRWALAQELRRDKGPAVVAERAWTALSTLQPALAVLDGVRNLDECKYLADRISFRLVAFHRPSELRYRRLATGSNEFYRRSSTAVFELDSQELRLGIGVVIALADYFYLSMANEEGLAADAAIAAAAIDEYARQESKSRAAAEVDREIRTRYSTLQALITSGS